MKFSEIEIDKKYCWCWKHLQDPTAEPYAKEVVTVIAKPGEVLAVNLRYGHRSTYPDLTDSDFNKSVRIRTADGCEYLVKAAELAPLEKDDTDRV